MVNVSARLIADNGGVIELMECVISRRQCVEKLRFSREKYVILTAYRCFKELDLDYRVVVGDDFDWWLSKQDAGIQRAFDAE